MFMQLLVAQLENQDPMNPADGTQFVTQLAQLQQLEQSVDTGQDVADIRTQVDAMAAAQSAANQTQTA
jgi:flagellar basal-body rod modification protein FlgD